MVYLVGDPGMIFRCREFTCLLNSQFNVVLFADYSVLSPDGKLAPLGFVVPTHYLSFIKTMSKSNSWSTDVRSVFQFKKDTHAQALQDYVQRIPHTDDFIRIRDLTAKAATKATFASSSKKTKK